MDKKTLYGQTSLHTAAIEGDVEIITNLIECKSNINEQDSYNNTPIILATYNNNFNAVELLLKKNANPNSQDKRKMTALMYACSFKNEKIRQITL